MLSPNINLINLTKGYSLKPIFSKEASKFQRVLHKHAPKTEISFYYEVTNIALTHLGSYHIFRFLSFTCKIQVSKEGSGSLDFNTNPGTSTGNSNHQTHLRNTA